MTPEDEKRVRELIDEDYWEGFKTRFFFWGALAAMAHFAWSEGGLLGLFKRLITLLFGQPPL